MPGSLTHLGRRFFDVLLAKPLAEPETAAVRHWLRGAEVEVFFSQPPADQRHGFHAAMTVLASEHDEDAAIRAALLHDVGKRHSGLGIIGRSMASLLIRLRLPLTKRALAYRDHGAIGSRELARLGCEALIVDFAMHHHGLRPGSIPPPTWDVLQRADQPPKTVRPLRT